MSLWAISDIHISYGSNREEWGKLLERPDDALIIAGDVGETVEQLNEVFELAVTCFKEVFWVPGNHELYTKPSDSPLKGEGKYMACVAAARRHGVKTPEDDYVAWTYLNHDGTPEQALICPIFTLYDYSFRPADVSREKVLDWSMEHSIRATDEALLHPDPYATRDEWCQRLVEQAETKLQQAMSTGLPLVIINHWPLREDLCYIPAVPRFSPWCGTKLTEDWHTKFNAKVVVTGHLHLRRTDWKDGVRFEEVSLGYPRQWATAKSNGHDVNSMLREILPGPAAPHDGEPSTKFKIDG